MCSKLDILMISETKVDDSFPIENFLIDVFRIGGIIMLFVREDILSKLLGMENKLIEDLYLELNMPND